MRHSNGQGAADEIKNPWLHGQLASIIGHASLDDDDDDDDDIISPTSCQKEAQTKRGSNAAKLLLFLPCKSSRAALRLISMSCSWC